MSLSVNSSPQAGSINPFITVNYFVCVWKGGVGVMVQRIPWRNQLRPPTIGFQDSNSGC